MSTRIFADKNYIRELFPYASDISTEIRNLVAGRIASFCNYSKTSRDVNSFTDEPITFDRPILRKMRW